MEAVLRVESRAVEARERLVVFMCEVADGLSLARQRANALLYVRGLIEQGGRKSLQPTLFRLQETPIPDLGVIPCACRTTPEGDCRW
jgi:hypothetical protein